MENNTLTSTSGFNQFPRGYKMAIIYNDDTCPYCGSSRLVPEYNTIENKRVFIRMICLRCHYRCPGYHPMNSPLTYKPLYDERVNNFINNFGTDIRERVAKIIQGGIEI